MKSAFKLMMIGGSTNSSTMSNNYHQEVELSKCLHKLFFQLLQMLEKLRDMIRAIQDSANASEYDLSPAVLSLQRELLACMSEMPVSECRLSTTSLNIIPRGDQHFDTLVLHMTNKQYKNALLSLRQLRFLLIEEFVMIIILSEVNMVLNLDVVITWTLMFFSSSFVEVIP